MDPEDYAELAPESPGQVLEAGAVDFWYITVFIAAIRSGVILLLLGLCLWAGALDRLSGGWPALFAVNAVVLEFLVAVHRRRVFRSKAGI